MRFRLAIALVGAALLWPATMATSQSAQRNSGGAGDQVSRLALPAGNGSPTSPAAGVSDSDDRPLRTWRGRFITLRTDAPPSYAHALLAKLDSFEEQANAALARLLDVPIRPAESTIIVFESQERYQRHARRHAPGLINNGGYYDGSTRTVVTYRFNNSMQLYFHELVHALMGEQFNDHSFSRYTHRGWPIWFDEGISEYIGSYAVDGPGIRVPAPNKGKLAYLANALSHNAFIDLASLLGAPAARFSGQSMNIFYAESWGLVAYIASHPIHSTRLPLFFQRIRAGEDGVAAFKACFGEDLAAFEASWRGFIDRAVEADRGWTSLFAGHSIDDWTVHEGGDWHVELGDIVGTGERNYNYLIKSEIPRHDFVYELDLLLERGTVGLILGNNYHGEYPYYYLIDVARDAVMLRRSYSATRIEPVKQAFAELPIGRWVRVQVRYVDRVLRVLVAGREVLTAQGDRDSYSLFGLYLYHAKARFRNIRLKSEGSVPQWATARQSDLVQPAGAGSISPGASLAPRLATTAPGAGPIATPATAASTQPTRH